MTASHTAECNVTRYLQGTVYIQPGTIAECNCQVPDLMTQPLPVAPPTTWVGREDRVRWCIENLTKGEHGKLCRLLKDKYAHYDLRALERTERESLNVVPTKKLWP